MTRSVDQKVNYSLRREIRVRRDKTAAILMPVFLQQMPGAEIEKVAAVAVTAADILIAELDRTRKDLSPQPLVPPQQQP